MTRPRKPAKTPTLPAGKERLTTEELAETFRGFANVTKLPGSTFRDSRTTIVMPTRDGKIHHRVVATLMGLLAPMNQGRHVHIVAGDEVGIAYNRAIGEIIAHPVLGQWPYILTLEDDNLPPADAHVKLLEAIEHTKADAASGLYFTKGEYGMPMAYGDPETYRRTGVLDFAPRDVRPYLASGQWLMPVNGIAMGCALWRTAMFREMTPPWFRTVSEVGPDGARAFTQDLWFCQRAKQAGKTFCVDLRVRVGHLDVGTGLVW